MTSEKLVKSNAKDALIFLYLPNITRATTPKAARPAIRIILKNSLPKTGEIVSSLTISSLKGRLPVMSTV